MNESEKRDLIAILINRIVLSTLDAVYNRHPQGATIKKNGDFFYLKDLLAHAEIELENSKNQYSSISELSNKEISNILYLVGKDLKSHLKIINNKM
jgi:hypothetical protein